MVAMDKQKTFIQLFSLLYAIPVLILLFILWKSREWTFHMNISKVTRRFGKKMALFGIFVFWSKFPEYHFQNR